MERSARSRKAVEHLFFRLILSIGGFRTNPNRARFSPSITARNEIVLHTRLARSPSLSLCQTIFSRRFYKHFFSIPRFFRYLLRSRFYAVYMAQRESTRVFDTIARKNLYVVQCRRVNEFLCIRLFLVISVKSRKSTILKAPFHHIYMQLILNVRFNLIRNII